MKSKEKIHDDYFGANHNKRYDILEVMQRYADEQTKERDELLESMGQTNKALCKRLEMYLAKYGEITNYQSINQQ